MKKIATLLFIIIPFTIVQAQNTFEPLGTSTYHLLDRYEILGGKLSAHYFTSCKPISKQSIADLAKENYFGTNNFSKTDLLNNIR